MLLSGWCMKGTQQHRYNQCWGSPAPHCFLHIPLCTSLSPPFHPICISLNLFSLFLLFISPSFLLHFSCQLYSIPFCLFSSSLSPSLLQQEDSRLLISPSSHTSHIWPKYCMCGYTAGRMMLLKVSNSINGTIGNIPRKHHDAQQYDQQPTCTYCKKQKNRNTSW